jgi:hypothetical protein
MRSNYLKIRVALIVAIVVAGVLFHHQGPAYRVIRVVYLVVIVGFLIWRLSLRSSRLSRRRDRDRDIGPGPRGPGGPPGM